MYNSEYYKEYPEDTGLDNILFSYFETFYKNIKEKTVIEEEIGLLHTTYKTYLLMYQIN